MEFYTATDEHATFASKTDIQQYAEELSNELEYITRKKTIYDLSKELGAKICFTDPLNDTDDFNGSMTINKDEKEIVITLSNLTTNLRNNFTIAHELGHLFLHATNMEERKISFTRYGSGRLEWEANWFAAAFLMPKKLFKKKCKEFNSNTNELSLHFNVSETAIKVRKQDLGI